MFNHLARACRTCLHESLILNFSLPVAQTMKAYMQIAYRGLSGFLSLKVRESSQDQGVSSLPCFGRIVGYKLLVAGNQSILCFALVFLFELLLLGKKEFFLVCKIFVRLILCLYFQTVSSQPQKMHCIFQYFIVLIKCH